MSSSGLARAKVKGVSLYPNTHLHKKVHILHNVKNPHSGNITLYHTIVSNILPINIKKKISPLTGLTSFLSKVVEMFVRVFMVKISQNFNKICFMPYSTTLSIKKQTTQKNLRRSKIRGGV